jgi:hypothetical protein
VGRPFHDYHSCHWEAFHEQLGACAYLGPVQVAGGDERGGLYLSDLFTAGGYERVALRCRWRRS